MRSSILAAAMLAGANPRSWNKAIMFFFASDMIFLEHKPPLVFSARASFRQLCVLLNTDSEDHSDVDPFSVTLGLGLHIKPSPDSCHAPSFQVITEGVVLQVKGGLGLRVRLRHFWPDWSGHEGHALSTNLSALAAVEPI